MIYDNYEMYSKLIVTKLHYTKLMERLHNKTSE